MFGLFASEARDSGGESVGRLIARKRYHRAAVELQEQITRTSDNVSLKLRLADVLLMEDRSGEALTVLEELADELMATGAFEKAIAVMRKILRIVPAHPAYRQRLDELLQSRSLPRTEEGGDSRSHAAPQQRASREDSRSQTSPPRAWSAEEIRALQTAPILSGVPPRALFRLVRELPPSTFEPGQKIFVEGEKGGEGLRILAAGTVKVLVRNPYSGNELVRTLTVGDHFGEVSLFSGGPHTATLAAATQVRLLLLERHRFERLAARYPRILARCRATCHDRALSAEEVAARGGIDFLL